MFNCKLNRIFRLFVVFVFFLTLNFSVFSSVQAAPLEFTQNDVDTVTTYLRPLTIDAIDLDEDGDTDVVVGDQYNDKITWYRNDGSENFTKVEIDSSFSYTRRLKVHDLDEDGDYDVIAANWSTIYWYDNDGSESFTKKEINASTSGEIDFDIVDIDKDNDEDIAVTDYSDGQVAWYENNGSESFTRNTIATGFSFAYHIDTGDFNGDNEIDFVACNQGNDIALFTNDGSEVFTKTAVDTDFSICMRIVAANLDGDSDLDIVAGSENGSNVNWYDNNGSGVFTEKSVGTSSDVYDVNVADLDGDSDLDVIVVDTAGADVLWFDNNGSETFTKRTIDSNFSNAYSVDVIDIDGDSDLDVVVGSSNGGQGNAGDTLDWYKAAADTANPTVQTLSPVDDAPAVATTSDLVVTFTEAVDAETGNIKLYKSDDTLIETFDVTSDISGSGSTAITINPAADLVELTSYYVQIDATAFDDEAGNSYAGITDETSWSFTAADETSPTVSTLSPTNGQEDVATTSNLVITFDENVDAESGDITLYDSSDAEIEAFDVTSDITGTGTTIITINPTSDLSGGTTYYVHIDATAFDDGSSNSYAGISDSATWTFTTVTSSSWGESSEDHNNKEDTVEDVEDETSSTDDTTETEEVTTEDNEQATEEANVDETDDAAETEEGSDPEIAETEDVAVETEEDVVEEEAVLLDEKVVTFEKDLSFDLIDDDVKRLQQYLNEQGFLVSTDSYGSPDNETEYFGELTRNALVSFQKANGLSETGYLDAATRGIINNTPSVVEKESTTFAGKILLQVEDNGEAWYVQPKTLEKHFLGRPDDAFNIMRTLSTGISENNYQLFQSNGVPSIWGGSIFLRVENNGEAIYVNPDDLTMHYLGRPEDAFNLMKGLGLGITNQDLANL